MQKTLWEEWGNKLNNKGSIVRVAVPLHWWLLDIWLDRVHNWWDKIPGWNKLWVKLLPDWGDPFCVAYCLSWSNFYWKQRKEEFNIEIGYENMSKEFKEAYEREL